MQGGESELGIKEGKKSNVVVEEKDFDEETGEVGEAGFDAA